MWSVVSYRTLIQQKADPQAFVRIFGTLQTSPVRHGRLTRGHVRTDRTGRFVARQQDLRQFEKVWHLTPSHAVQLVKRGAVRTSKSRPDWIKANCNFQTKECVFSRGLKSRRQHQKLCDERRRRAQLHEAAGFIASSGSRESQYRPESLLTVLSVCAPLSLQTSVAGACAAMFGKQAYTRKAWQKARQALCQMFPDADERGKV